MLKKYWWMINLPDHKGKTALDRAKEENKPWLINLLTNPSLIQQKEPFDWVKACEKDETTWAVLAFIDNCQDLQNVCNEQNDTPLHHIKLPTYDEYLNLLKKPSIADIKNTPDFEGATPLHRALEKKDMLLARALLVDREVDYNIQDYGGTTAISLLAKLCKEDKEWERMCKQIKVNPHFKATYIQRETNQDQMRNTLSVVAALLATITFAAGFTLPGGLDEKTGNANLSTKASFLVFLLADAYAMCTSMLVLFCLIWSMVSKADMSTLLVDRSVHVLMQALYGTMVAFMTGIYTVVAHDSLWAAIIILVMCVFIVISANRTVLRKLLAMLVPAANLDQSLEKGKSTPTKNSTTMADQENLINAGNEDLEQQNPLLAVKEENASNGHDDTETTEGTSTKLFHNPTSVARMKNVPAENQDEEDQIRMLEEGQASNSGNDDAKAKGSCSEIISEG